MDIDECDLLARSSTNMKVYIHNGYLKSKHPLSELLPRLIFSPKKLQNLFP